jgi:hypothetical protein
MPVSAATPISDLGLAWNDEARSLLAATRLAKVSPEEEGGDESFVGGFIVSYPNIPLAKYRFSWPFARLTLAAHELQLSARFPVDLLMRPIVIPYREISFVEVRIRRLQGTFVIHTPRRDLGRISFGVLKVSGLDRVLELLERKGLIVERR